MLLSGACLQQARDGCRPAGLWGDHLGFTVLGSRSTSAPLSSPWHPRDRGSHSRGLQDPKHEPPALRRGLFNSRNSFSFSSAW